MGRRRDSEAVKACEGLFQLVLKDAAGGIGVTALDGPYQGLMGFVRVIGLVGPQAEDVQHIGSYLLAIPALVMAILWFLKGPWMRSRGHTAAAPLITGASAKAGKGTTGRPDDCRSFARLVAVIVGWSIPYVR
ncbi:hypothetical protein AB0G85_00385 [Streptomyces sioyaensis]|uniref:hypothetical protein n=1 Tax=Streptomyces sioyaensis TaxID=67364 RepID=UPI0033C7D6A7